MGLNRACHWITRGRVPMRARDDAATCQRPRGPHSPTAAVGFIALSGVAVLNGLVMVVIGGVVSATLLTLVVLPAVYRMWHRDAASDSPPAAPTHPGA